MDRGGGARGAAAFFRGSSLAPIVLVAASLAATHAFAAPAYPLSARLRMAPKEEQHCMAVGAETDCGVLDAVDAAFARVVSRMFHSGAAPDLDLVVQVRNAEISRVLGLQFELSTRVRVRTAAGEPIDEIDAASSAPLLGEEKSSLANAIGNAADDAALVFQRKYANDSKVADFLIAKNVASGPLLSPRERSDRLVSLSAGGGFVQGGGDGGIAVAAGVRAAFAWRWLFVQGMYARYAPSFEGVDASLGGPFGVETGLTTNDLGFESGGVYRLTPSIELRGGPGIHFIFGDATIEGSPGSPGTSQSFSKAVPSLFASISSSFFVSPNAPRLVVTAESRAYFFSSVDLPSLRRTVPAANTSFAVLLGMELPWKSRK